jgi:hypothetical protein
MKSKSLYFAKEGQRQNDTQIIIAFFRGAETAESLSRELIVEEVRNFGNLIDAARGRVEVRNPASPEHSSSFFAGSPRRRPP